jgi:putative membrane protein
MQKANSQENKPSRASTSGSLTSVDRSFVSDASDAGAAEVAHGQLAIIRASNPEVKSFAQRMLDDHTKANQDLMQLATIKGLTPRSGMTSESTLTKQQAQLKGKSRDMMSKWSKLSGAEFDREYMKAQVKDHEKAVSLFEKEASGGSDPDLKSFAGKTLPKLKDHLQMAREVASKVGTSMPRRGTGY